MKVTVILKDFTEAFYDGFGDIVGLLQMSDSDKFSKLNKMAHEKRVKMRIGNGQFREAVELAEKERFEYAYARAVRSLAYSVGIFHADYQKAAKP